jgi:hypothetical protein
MENEYRFTEQEYLSELEKVLDERLDYLQDNIGEVFKSEEAIKNMNKTISKLKTKLENKMDDPYARIKLKIDTLSNDTRYWSERSISPDSKKFIIMAILTNKLFNVSFMCESFMCYSDLMSADMLPEIMFIESGLFSFDTWDDYHVNIIENYYTDLRCDEITKKECKEYAGKIPNKLTIDWKGIASSLIYYDKYINIINENT